MRISGDYAEAKRRYEMVLEFAREHGAKGALLNCLWDLAYAELLDARFSRAQELAAEGERLAVEAGAMVWRLSFLQIRSESASFAGQVQLALQFARAMRPIAERIGSRGAVALERMVVGLALFEAGELEASRAALEEGLRLTDRDVVFAFTYRAAHLIRVLVSSRDLAAARELLDETAGIEVAWSFSRIYRPAVAATVYAAEGDFATADRLFRESLEASRPPAPQYFRAYALLEYARFLVGRRRIAEAVPVLEEAHFLYADPLASRRREEIDELQRRCDEIGMRS